MTCPHCGGETPASRGVCTSCHRSLADAPTVVATGVLTPLPEPSSNQPSAADDQPPATTWAGGDEPEDVTRLGPALSAPATLGTPQPAPMTDDDNPDVTRLGDVTGLRSAPDAPPSKTPQAPPPENEDPDVTRLGMDRPATAGARTSGRSSVTGRTGGGGPAASGPLSTGQDFGNRYHIIRVLGVGGMGAVYQAWDQELEVAVAVKVVRTEATNDPIVARDLERRFKRELLLARQVTHRNVVRIHDLGEIDGIKYITMPYIQGVDLATVLKRDGTLPVSRALRIARQVASGLAAAHQAGVIHRDLKPANIMIDGDDNAVIMDFGIAKSATGTGAGLTIAGSIVGTVEYMAPEQARGEEPDQRVDIYAFGLIFYDMLVRRRQSSASESAVAELMARMQQAPPPPRAIDPNVPEAVDQIIVACIQPNPAARFQKSADLSGALDALDTEGHPGGTAIRTTAFSVPVAPPAATMTTAATVAIPVPARRMPWLTWKAGLAAAALLLAITGVVFRERLPFGTTSAPAPSGETISLAILPFRNASGDPSLDWLGSSLAEMLRTEVGESASFRTVSSDRLHQILRDLRISGDSTLDPASLGRLAEFSNASTVLWGQYLRFGSEIRIDATLQDVKRQRTIPLKAQAPSESALLGAIEQLAQSIREGLALSSNVVDELRARAFKPSSNSVQALRYYNEGLQLVRQGKQLEAQKKFEAATQEDGEFALAYSKLAQTHADLGYTNEAQQFSRRAVSLSESLPPQEKYLIQAGHARILNDTTKAIESYVNLEKVSPDNEDVLFNLATLYEDTGAFDLAHERYMKLLARDPKSIDALVGIGRVEIGRGNPQAALEHLNRALALAVQLENEEARATILLTMGDGYRGLNKPEEALRYFQDSLAIWRKVGQKGGISDSLRGIAVAQSTLGKSDLALKAFEECLQLRREIGDSGRIGATLIDFGSFYTEMGQYNQALARLREALQIQRDLGRPGNQALVLQNIGTTYFFKGSYEEALTYYERSLTIREKLKVPGDIADALHNLGETAAKMGQFDQAASYYLKALELRRGAGDKRGAAIDSYMMGALFEYQGRYGAAVSTREEALKAIREVGDKSYWLAEILSGYGSALNQIGRGDDGQKSLEEALGLARELQNDTLVAQTLGFQGDRLFYRGDYKPARALYEQGLAAATRAGDGGLALTARISLAKLDTKDGRAPAAARALRGLATEADSQGLKYLAVESQVYLGEALLNSNQAAAGADGTRTGARQGRAAGPSYPARAEPSPAGRCPAADQPCRGPPAQRGRAPNPRRDSQGSAQRPRPEARRPQPDSVRKLSKRFRGAGSRGSFSSTWFSASVCRVHRESGTLKPRTVFCVRLGHDGAVHDVDCDAGWPELPCAGALPDYSCALIDRRRADMVHTVHEIVRIHAGPVLEVPLVVEEGWRVPRAVERLDDHTLGIGDGERDVVRKVVCVVHAGHFEPERNVASCLDVAPVGRVAEERRGALDGGATVGDHVVTRLGPLASADRIEEQTEGVHELRHVEDEVACQSRRRQGVIVGVDEQSRVAGRARAARRRVVVRSGLVEADVDVHQASDRTECRRAELPVHHRAASLPIVETGIEVRDRRRVQERRIKAARRNGAKSCG